MSSTVKEVTLSKRGLRMAKKPISEVQKIAKSGSLSAAAASFELQRRKGVVRATNL